MQETLAWFKVLSGTGLLFTPGNCNNSELEEKVLEVRSLPSIRNAFLMTSRDIWFTTETSIHFQYTSHISIAWLEHKGRTISKPSKPILMAVRNSCATSWICKLDCVFVYNALQALTYCRRVSALPTHENIPLPNDGREKPVS